MHISLGFLGMGMPILLGQREGKGPGDEVGVRKGRQEGENGFTSSHLLPMVPCASSQVTPVSRSPLCEK